MINITKDFEKNSILAKRIFTAKLTKVWEAFSEAKYLNNWWVPPPWKTDTVHIDFKVDGYWFYVLTSHSGAKHYGRINYTAIDINKSIEIEDVPCDENGNYDKTLAPSKGKIAFFENENETKVHFEMTYSPAVDLEKIYIGFELGIKACFGQLDELLKNEKI